MSYKVNFDALDSLCININTQVSEWITDINSVGESLNAILNGNNITGSGAENIKSYLQTVHAAIIQSLILILQSHAQNCLMYKSDYQQNIDTSLHAVIKCEELFDIRKQLTTKRSEMWGVDSSIINALTNVSDLIYTNLDSSDDMDALYGTINTTLLNLESDISNLESSHLNNDFSDVQNMISSLKLFINDQLSKSRGYLVEYTPHQLANSDVYANLFNANQVLVASQSERTDEFQLACEHENNRAELLEAEAAQKREEEGWWSAFAAVGTIVVGTVAIVCTAGMATPIVVTAVVAGGSSILYGASNLVEAGQDIYYGSIGDATTVAFNPIRDTVFAGNQELYDIWGEISVTVAGFVVPVGQAYTTAKAAGSTTKVVVTTVGKATVKEVMEDTAVNWVSSGAGDLVMDLTGDANASRLFGLGAGFLAGNLNSLDDVSDVARKMDNVTDTTEIFDDVNDVTRKIDDVTDSTKTVTSLSELMSPEDAAKYNDFLENGSTSGFTPTEIRGFQNCDDVVALNKINYDDVVDIRNNTVSIEDVAYERYWQDKITSIPKGSRPDPSEYLSQEYIDNHLAQFDDGVSVIQTEWAYSRYSETNGFVGVPDDNTLFVMPKKYCDEVILKANGDISVIEKELGFPQGYFSDGGGLVRIDTDNVSELNVRVPSGNETGANKLWLPGGYTSGGVPEAVTDIIPLTDTTITRLTVD